MKRILAVTATFALMALTTTADAQSTLTHREILGWRCGDSIAIVYTGHSVEILVGARVPSLSRISIMKTGAENALSMNGQRCEALRSMFRRPDALLPAATE